MAAYLFPTISIISNNNKKFNPPVLLGSFWPTVDFQTARNTIYY